MLRPLVKTACYSGAGALAGFVAGALVSAAVAPHGALGLSLSIAGILTGAFTSTNAAWRTLRIAR